MSETPTRFTPLPRTREIILTPDYGPVATQLMGYAEQMFNAAVYWTDLGNEDRAIQCHQTSALYHQAAMAAFLNKV